jgi:tRNA threonylcarbamoyladenosine biosynthesis protein TsaB
MNLLAFDTSTDTVSIAVQRGAGDDARLWQYGGPGGAQASATLVPAILRLMHEAGLAFKDLDAIAFGCGPGSFTGLRTACSVAQGLAYGGGIPVLPVGSLMAVAEEARLALQDAGGQPGAHLRVAALLDARMDELYAANYSFDKGLWQLHETQGLIRPEDVGAQAAFAEGAGSLPTPGVLSLCAGNVFEVYAGRIDSHGLACVPALPTARAMLSLAPQLLRAGLAVPAAEALPLYIRDKVAKTTQERLAEKSGAALAASL